MTLADAVLAALTQPAARWLDKAVRRAAVCGRFIPASLLADVPAAEQDLVAGELSLLCDEDPDGGGRAWVLQPSVRRRVLASFDQKGAVEAALAGAPDPDPDDAFAMCLRRLLTQGSLGKVGPTAAKDPKAQAARHAALQFALAAPLTDQDLCRRELNDTRGWIGAQQQAEAITAVLPTRLFGRRAEARRLLDFAEGKDPDTRPVLVTGIAGVGKSALTASVLKTWAAKGRAALLLDFDRADLSSGRPIPIAREMLRQLEALWLVRADAPVYAAAVEAVAGLREAIRQEEKAPTVEGDAAQESWVFSTILGEIRNTIPQQAVGESLLVVFDSFEIVAGQGPEVVERVLRFEVQLRTEAGLAGVRTIVSGREAPVPQAQVEGRFGPSSRRVHVEGLSPAAGAEFLAEQDRRHRFPEAGERQQISRALAGHPLALIVLERFARDRSAKAVRALVADLESNAEFKAEFAQAFVYTRILDRIRDPVLEALAHPGLVLRDISADLIRLVLAGRCGLGEIDARRADDLLALLAGQYWLVEARGGDHLRHRPDLRRLMLPGMFAGPGAKDRAAVAARKAKLQVDSLKVCHAAAAYYAKGPPKGDDGYNRWAAIPERARRAEATYYRALAGIRAPQLLDRTKAADLKTYLREDLATLPPAWRGLVKAAADDFDSLSDIERQALRGRLREEADLRIGERSLQAGQAASAKTATPRSAAARDSRSTEVLDQTVRAAFDECDWGTVSQIGGDLIQRWARYDRGRRAAFEMPGSGLWSAGIWKAMLHKTLEDRSAAPLVPGPQRHTIDPDLSWVDWSLASLAPREGREMSPPRLERLPPYVDGLRTLVRLRWRGPPTNRQTGAVEARAFALADPAIRVLGSGSFPNMEAFDALRDHASGLSRGQFSVADLNRAYGAGDIHLDGRFEAHPARAEVQSVLRGLSPELHEPAARLLRALPTLAAMEFAESVARRSDVWPYDLWFDGPRGPPTDVKRRRYETPHAALVIQTADRCGVLRPALELLAQRNPLARPLAAMHDVITRSLFDLP